MHTTPINILIVDDHPSTRAGLRGYLETVSNFRIVAEAGSAMEAVCCVRNGIDIVLMDIDLSGTSGFDLTERLLGINSSIKVIMFTQFGDEENVLRAIRIGASGYIVKTSALKEIKKTINNIYEGQKVFPPIVQYHLLLTSRERQVFWLIGNEWSNDQISTRLNIEIRTVEGHRSHIWQKLKPTLSEEKSKNPDIMIIKAVKYSMQCEYPEG